MVNLSKIFDNNNVNYFLDLFNYKQIWRIIYWSYTKSIINEVLIETNITYQKLKYIG